MWKKSLTTSSIHFVRLFSWDAHKLREGKHASIEWCYVVLRNFFMWWNLVERLLSFHIRVHLCWMWHRLVSKRERKAKIMTCYPSLCLSVSYRMTWWWILMVAATDYSLLCCIKTFLQYKFVIIVSKAFGYVVSDFGRT